MSETLTVESSILFVVFKSGGSEGKESTCNTGDPGSVEKIPWRRVWQPTPGFLPGASPWAEECGGLQSIGSGL